MLKSPYGMRSERIQTRSKPPYRMMRAAEGVRLGSRCWQLAISSGGNKMGAGGALFHEGTGLTLSIASSGWQGIYRFRFACP